MSEFKLSLPRPRGFLRRLRTLGLAVFAVGAAGAAGAVTAGPAPPDAATAKQIEAGRYLAAAAHCGACHTSRADRPFAGNLPIPSPFGTMYSSNITPDPATGIGRWTEAEFEGALRRGKGRHGEYLYPSMPYTDFTKTSDADVHALWIYLRSLPPIVEPRKPNAMKFPFNVRAGIAAWQAVFFKPGRYVDDPTRSVEWNRGAYLVQGLGHCGACHTPRNAAMATKAGHDLQGAATGDAWFAPDISGGRFSGLREWSEADIVAFLKTGHNAKNVAAVGPMLATIAEGTQKLSDADLRAMAGYLKHQPVDKPADAPRPVAMSDERRAAGAAVYESNCQSCHGADGRGVDGIAPALAGNTSVTARGAENIVHSVLEGYAPTGRWGAMPSFAQALDGQQIADVANYVRSAWHGDASASVTPWAVNEMRAGIGAPDPRIAQALTCPAVPAAAVDDKTKAALTGLVKAERTRVPPGLLGDYRRRHPDIDPSQAVNLLAGSYCRLLVTEGGGSTAQKQSRYIAFTSRVAAQAAR